MTFTLCLYIISSMCSPALVYISLVMCVPQARKHISLVICVSREGEHISPGICVSMYH